MAPPRYPMVTYSCCLDRKRTITLWYLPRSGTPTLHLGLPAGWSVRQGLPICPQCLAADVRRATKRGLA